MLNITSLKKSFGGKNIFTNLTLHINDGERIGLIGPNGSGKTTLLKIITGEISQDSGNVIYPKNSLIGYLPQTLVELQDTTLIEEVLSSFPEIAKIKKELLIFSQNQRMIETDAERYAILNNKYNELGGFAIEHEAKEILRGMGFKEDELNKKNSIFSGGWQMRILLSKILLTKPDILLLDEPTNHLDIETLNWLENFLKNFKGIIIAVTHDRYFLDKFTRRICELDNGIIKNYYGTYEDFLFEKNHMKESVRKKYQEQKKRIEQIQRFINKYRARKDMRKKVRSRIKMLEKMELIELPRENKGIHFTFPQPPRSGLIVVNLSQIKKSYGNNVVLDGVDLKLDRGDKLGIVGPNGIGKSTLLRIIAGKENFDSGERKIGYNVSLQYFSQEDSTVEAKGKTIFEEVQSVAPELEMTKLRSYLGAFLFSGSDVEKNINILSGGEKSRLKLAKMLLKPANLLILDEPTNHLDIKGKEVLEEALFHFTGTVVIVSHDRFTLDKVCNKIATIEDKKLKLYWGNYSYYLEKKQEERNENIEEKKKISRKNQSKERKRLEAQKRQKIYNYKKEAELLEKILMEQEEEISKKEKLLLLPETYKENKKVKELMKEIEKLKKELEDTYYSLGEKYKIIDELKTEL
ncbi:MAG: hypothetical protein B5M53_07205 [Candidatus Cloacimonas sp. 4484_209]|nr:MAG: hypothetical protein B5M53_07205 [Candidatus Cloacimonas sp. 4484_209]